MTEPGGPAALDVVLVCASGFSVDEVAHLSTLVTREGFRCFASTLVGEQGRLNVPGPWNEDPSQDGPTRAPEEHNSPDRILLLDDLLSRIAAKETHRRLDLIVIGDAGFRSPRQLHQRLSMDTGAPAGSNRASMLRRIAWLCDERGGAGNNDAGEQDGFLITTIRRPTLADAESWLTSRALPWLVGGASDLGDAHESD